MLELADSVGALCMERMTSPPFGLRGGKAGGSSSRRGGKVTVMFSDLVASAAKSRGCSVTVLSRPEGVPWMLTPGIDRA